MRQVCWQKDVDIRRDEMQQKLVDQLQMLSAGG
jgi:hypothetical protein